MEAIVLRVMIAGLLAGTPLAGQSAFAAEKGPVVLEPSSKWVVDYADDSCRLARTFGTGEDKALFYLERFSPQHDGFVMVGGKPLAPYSRRKAYLRFVPLGGEKKQFSFWGDFSGYAPALMVGSLAIVDQPDDEWDTDPPPPEDGPAVTEEQEQATNAIEVVSNRKARVRLALGPMGDAFAALRKCTDTLVNGWGVDAEADRHLTRRPHPKSWPGKWVRPDDYPTQALRKGTQGIIPFRLIVGPDGVPTDCKIQALTETEAFDQTVCKIMMKRARFEPALDAEGQPIKSYWSSLFNFSIR